MAEPTAPAKDDDEPEGFLGRIRDMITDRETRKKGAPPVGTGGEARKRKIDSMVDAMSNGIDESKGASRDY